MKKLLFLLILIGFAISPQISKALTPFSEIIPGDLQGKFSFGITSNQVSILQIILASDPSIYPEGNITGIYDTLTVYAVERFQCKYMSLCSGSPDINGYGLAGPITRAKIEEVMLSQIDNSTEVLQIGEEITDAVEEVVQPILEEVDEIVNTDVVTEKEGLNIAKLLKLGKVITVLQSIVENIHLATRALVDKVK
jgi:hypothetical protein